jgi:two-component system, LuxR family, sensor kinase FixL
MRPMMRPCAGTMADAVHPDMARPGGARSLLEEIVASSNDAIIGKTLDGIVTSWNEAAEHLFGYHAAEMIGQPITRLIPPDRIDEEALILERLGRGERLSHYETVRIAKDGHSIEISATISPIRDASGTVIGASKIARDLTGLHRLTRELRKREALLQSILGTVPDGLIIIDNQARIQSFNPAAEQMFGFSAAEIVGHNVRTLMPSGYAAAHDEYLARFLQTGERRIIGIGRVVTGKRKNGSEFPMELQVGEVMTEGAPLFTGFVRDLTERLDSERRLDDMRSELAHATRLTELGQMVSTLAHEVNQPLTAIGAYLGGIRRLLPADIAPVLRESLEKAAAQATRAHEIVQSLRGLVRKEQRPHTVESLEDMVRDISDLAFPETRSGIILETRIPVEACLVQVDRVQIQQVLLNLFRNAADAMEGAAMRRLTVTASRLAGRIEVAVGDTGTGLAQAIQVRLFEPFVTTKGDGLGVGLSICRQIVEAHGGTLSAASEPGRGAVFRFTLPPAP